MRSPEQAASTLNSFSVLSENAGSVRFVSRVLHGQSRCFLGYQNYGQVYDWIVLFYRQKEIDCNRVLEVRV